MVPLKKYSWKEFKRMNSDDENKTLIVFFYNLTMHSKEM